MICEQKTTQFIINLYTETRHFFIKSLSRIMASFLLLFQSVALLFEPGILDRISGKVSVTGDRLRRVCVQSDS